MPSKSRPPRAPAPRDRREAPDEEAPEQIDNSAAQAELGQASSAPSDGGGGAPDDGGNGGPLPFLGELEARFGQPLGHVEAVTGRRSIRAMNADAVAVGSDKVVFADPSPDLETVAEEVAHLFQPVIPGQDLSAPNDPSEDEASAAAAAVARGEDVDPSSLTTAGAQLQRKYAWWNPWSWGDDTPDDFAWKDAEEAAEAETDPLPIPTLETRWHGSVYVAESDEDFARLHDGEGTATYEGLSLMTREDFDELVKQADADLQAVRQQFIDALSSGSTLVEAKKAVLDLGATLRGDEATARLLPHLYADPAIFGHYRMIELQEADPDFVLGLAAMVDPLAELKGILRRRASGQPFWDELTTWARTFPEQGARATADAEIMELIARGAMEKGLDDTSKALKSPGVMVAFPGAAAMLTGSDLLGLDIEGGLAATLGDEDAVQVRILQLLMNGGVEPTDARARLDQALADGDENAFFEAWKEVVQDQPTFNALKADPVFVTDVDERLGSKALARVRADFELGVSERGGEDGLSDSEAAKIEAHSRSCAAAIYKRTSSTWAASFTANGNKMLDDLERWGSAVEAELAGEGGQVSAARRAEAQRILKATYEALAGRPLVMEFRRHANQDNVQAAIAILGDGSGANASDTEAAAEAGFRATLSDEELRALDPVLRTAVSDLRYQLQAYFVTDRKVQAVLDTFHDTVDDLIQPEVPEGVSEGDPRAAWACKRRRMQARNLLSERYADGIDASYGATLEDQLVRGLQGGSETHALDFFAEAQREDPMPDDPNAYSAELSRSEKARVDEILGVAAKRLYDEFENSVYNDLADTVNPLSYLDSAINGTREGAEFGVDDVDVLAALKKAETDLRETLAPATQDASTVPMWNDKVRTAMTLLPRRYEPFGILEQELEEHVWERGIKRQCQILIGGREAPGQSKVNELLEGIPADHYALADSLLRQFRESSFEIVLQLDKELNRSGFLNQTSVEVVEGLAIDFQTLVAAAPMMAAGSLPGFMAAWPGFMAFQSGVTAIIDSLPPTFAAEILEQQYAETGGDLAYAIAEKVPDSDTADALLERFGLPDVAASKVAADPELTAALETLEQSGADLGDSEEDAETRAAFEAAATTVKAQIRARQQLAVRLAPMFDAIEHLEEGEDTEDSGWKKVLKAAKPIASIEARDDAPVRLVDDPTTAEEPLERDEGLRLIDVVYQDTFHISLSEHVALRLTSALATSLAEALGIAPFAPSGPSLAVDEGELAESIQVDPLDAAEGFDGEVAIARAKDIRAIVLRARGAMGLDDTKRTLGQKAVSVIGRAVLSKVYIAFDLYSASSNDTAMAELSVGVARLLGKDKEAEAIRHCYQQLYGTSLAFELHAVHGGGSALAEAEVRAVEHEDTSFVQQILALAAEKRTDEIYVAVFKASDPDKQAVLDTPEALHTLRKLGPKPYDRIYRSLTGALTLAEMMRSRDGSSDDHAWYVTEVWDKSMLKMGMGEDSAKMKEDVTLFVTALKEKITEAKQQHVVVKGDCLWDLSETYTGDPTRWKELYALNKEVVGADPHWIYTDQTLRLPPAWVKDLVSTSFKAQCREMMDSRELRAIFEPMLSADEKLELQLLIADGGTLSAEHKVLVDVKGLGTSDSILDDLKAMKDEERAAAAKDPRFLTKLTHDLDGKDLKKALAILHGKQAEDGLSETQFDLASQGMFGVEEGKAIDGVLSLGMEETLALSKDALRMAELHKGLGDNDEQSQLFQTMMKDARASLSLPTNLEERDAQGQIDAEIEQQRQFIRFGHQYAILNASFGGASTLLEKAQDAYAEKGAIKHPADKDKKKDDRRTIYVWGPSERDGLWANLEADVNKRWGKAPVNDLANVAAGVGGTGGVVLGVAGLAASAPLVATLGPILGIGGAVWAEAEASADADGNRDERTWAEVVEQAVLGQSDPAIVRMGKGLAFNNSKEDVKGAIAAAGDTLVIERWSNIDRPGASGSSLRDKWTSWAVARQKLADARAAGKDAQTVQELHAEERVAFHYYLDFPLTYSAEIETTLTDAGSGLSWLTSSTRRELLEYKEAVMDRILSVEDEAIAEHFGIGSRRVQEDGTIQFEAYESVWVEDDNAGEDGDKFVDVDLSDEDVSTLTGTDRSARSKLGITMEKVDHQISGGSVADTFTDGKQEIGYAGRDYVVANFKAQSREEGEDVARVTDDEAKDLEDKLAAVDRSIADYKATKKKVADWMKKIVGTALAVVSALVSGPAGPSFFMSLVLAGTEATLAAGIDAMVQGNDYDGFKEAIPAVLSAVATEAFTHGMEKGWGGLMDSWPAAKHRLADNPFTKFGSWLGDGFDQFGAPGEIVKDALKDGIYKPSISAFTEPMLHLIDPNALKWGTQSTWNEAKLMLDANLVALPETWRKKTWEGLKSGAQEKLIGAILGKDDDKKTGPVPGVEVAAEAPDLPNLWTSMKASYGDLTKQFKRKELKKAAVTFLVEKGVLVLESSRPGATFEEIWQVDLDAESIIDSLYGSFDAFVTGVAKDYAKDRNTRKAWDQLQEDKQELAGLGLEQLLPGAEPSDIEGLYKAYLEGEVKGAGGFGDGTLEDFKKSVAVLQKQLAYAHERLENDEQRTLFTQWVLEDPSEAEARWTKQDAFLKNVEKGQAHMKKLEAKLNALDLPRDQRAYAEAMITSTESFDFETGEASGHNLLEADGLKGFQASYLKMKKEAALQLIEYDDEEKQAAWKEHVEAMELDDWESFPFLPTAAPTDIHVQMLKASYEHDRGLKARSASPSTTPTAGTT